MITLVRRYSDVIIYIASLYFLFWSYDYFFHRLPQKRSPVIYPGLDVTFHRQINLVVPQTDLKDATASSWSAELSSKQLSAEEWLRQAEEAARLQEKKRENFSSLQCGSKQ